MRSLREAKKTLPSQDTESSEGDTEEDDVTAKELIDATMPGYEQRKMIENMVREKKAAKKSKTAQLKVPVAEVKAVEKTDEEEADLFLGTDDVAAVAVAQQSVMPKGDELEFEEIDDAADSSDEEDDEGLELSETMTVAGVEYFFTEQDGQTILFTKAGEPVGIYDAETDTVQECEFDDE